ITKDPNVVPKGADSDTTGPVPVPERPTTYCPPSARARLRVPGTGNCVVRGVKLTCKTQLPLPGTTPPHESASLYGVAVEIELIATAAAPLFVSVTSRVELVGIFVSGKLSCKGEAETVVAMPFRVITSCSVIPA